LVGGLGPGHLGPLKSGPDIGIDVFSPLVNPIIAIVELGLPFERRMML